MTKPGMKNKFIQNNGLHFFMRLVPKLARPLH